MSSAQEAPDEPTAAFVEEWRNAAYNCFSSGHKFCREVCPVMQVTRDEVHTPTAFHANVVAMEQGLLSIAGRGPRLRALHPVRRLRAALPEHAVHRRLLPLPHPHGAAGQGGARARRRRGHPPAALAAVGRGDRPRRSPSRCSAEVPVSQDHVARLGRRPRPADRRRDDPLLRLRGRLPPHLGAPRRGEDPPGRGRRVRPDARAVVLRRSRRRDGLRRPGAASSPGTTSTTGGRSAPGGSSCSTRTTTSPSPRTTRATSATTTTSRSCSSSSWSPS